MSDTDYRIQHRPPTRESCEIGENEFAYEIGKKISPSDYLSNPAMYQDMSQKSTWEAVMALRRIQGRPNAYVTVYRGAPSSELNTGDWVSLSRTYAEEYAKGGPCCDNENSRVHKFRVKAKDLTFECNDMRELGYVGPKIREHEIAFSVHDIKKEYKNDPLSGKTPVGFSGTLIATDLANGKKQEAGFFYDSPFADSDYATIQLYGDPKTGKVPAMITKGSFRDSVRNACIAYEKRLEKEQEKPSLDDVLSSAEAKEKQKEPSDFQKKRQRWVEEHWRQEEEK